MTGYRKKLIEVALPLKAINEESSLRKRKAPAGYPTTIHKWWAQRPLAACRAVLFSSLVNDPSDDPMYGVSEEIAASERAKLFNLIEELVLWENSNSPRVINAARAEIARSIAANKVADGEWKNDQVVITAGGKQATVHDFKHKLASPEAVNSFLVEHAPPVLDPFCGGGSIPLEAQRLGLRTLASDLNPIPVLITKALAEIPPKFAGWPPINPEWQASSVERRAASSWQGAQGLAADVRFYGKWVREEACRQLGHLFPGLAITAELANGRPELTPYIGRELPVVAWLWTRTVISPNPACAGSRVPLVRTFMLSTKKAPKAFAYPEVSEDKRSYRFHVRSGVPPAGFDPKKGTVGRTGAKCVLSGDNMPLEYIRDEAKAGRMQEELMAVVVEGDAGRLYVSPTPEQVRVARSAEPTGYPDSPMPDRALGFRVQRYGFDHHFNLFTARQLAFHVLVTELLKRLPDIIARDAMKGIDIKANSGAAHAYAEGVVTYLGCAFARSLEYNSAFASWRPKDNAMRSTFSKQSLPMIWDFAEANPLEKSSAGFVECCQVIAKCIERLPAAASSSVEQLDATAMDAAPTRQSVLVCTDPPYYGNIGYADLSDFFYVWHRKALSNVYRSLFSTVLTPKAQELIATPYRHDDKDAAKDFFESGFVSAFGRLGTSADPGFPTTVFYAFKQSESDDDDDDDDTSPGQATVASTGWETMLEGLVKSNLSITGTWPMRTEGDNRQVGLGTNALASSIVLVCRPRRSDASLATRQEFMHVLRAELPGGLKSLQQGNIAPVDLAQAAIGPGMDVFTRYVRVIESDGSRMPVRTALGIINQVLDEVLAEQEGEFDAETRWALAWFEQFGIEEGPFGEADVLARAKNTAVNGLVEAGIINAKSGKVRLVDRSELPVSWDPTKDKRLTVWETVQHLIRTLEADGEADAAALVNKLGGMAETARDLAYRLYSICERKKWAEEALAYNSLVIAWPELSKLALTGRNRQPAGAQQEMF